MVELEVSMNRAQMSAMFDELQKIAAVPKATKMYRRALQLLNAGDTHAAWAFHGTGSEENIPKILQQGVKKTQGMHLPEGELAGHFWKDRPIQGYINSPTAVGVATKMRPIQAIAHEKMYSSGASRDPRRQFMIVARGPEGSTHIPLSSGKDTYAIAPRSVVNRIGLDNQYKIAPRTIDPKVWNRAEADYRARHTPVEFNDSFSPEDVKTPSSKYLTRLLKGKEKPPLFEDMRSGLPKYQKAFTEDYAKKTGIL